MQTMQQFEHHNPGSSWVDIFTAIGTVGATIVAVVAAAIAIKIAKRERAHQALTRRIDWATDLLAAFESVQQLRAYHWESEAKREKAQDAPEMRGAWARYLALLRISQEDLRINEGNTRHIPFGASDEEANYLESAPMLGNPELERPDVMQCRAEIVNAIKQLQDRISKTT